MTSDVSRKAFSLGSSSNFALLQALTPLQEAILDVRSAPWCPVSPLPAQQLDSVHVSPA